MKVLQTFKLIIFCMLLEQLLGEPITLTAGMTGALLTAVGIASYNTVKCYKNECCDDKWIKFNLTGFHDDLNQKVFGQHLVNNILLKLLPAHMNKKENRRALVLSFHGWTGSGKNFVSKIIVDNLFYKHQSSKFYHLYTGTEFSHKENINSYRSKLRREVEEATTECERNLFVFDEVDKMQPGVLDALVPYLDFHESINKVDYRKNIFIFLSNAGGDAIAKRATEFWAEGRNREDLTVKDVERFIGKGAYNEYGGLQHSDIVKKELIDVYVPFLPLEKKHVKQCVRAELLSRNIEPTERLIDEVADQMIYEPDEVELFSVSGCKKVGQRVDLVI